MAIDFESSNSSRLTFPTGASGPTQFQNRGAMSIACWFTPESIVNATLIGVSTNNGGVPTTNTRFNLKIASANSSLECNARAPDSGGQVTAVGTNNAVAAGARAHLCTAVDVAGDVDNLYVNGALNSSPAVAYTNAATDNTVSASGAMASEEDGSTSPFQDGVMMDALLYSRQLNANEVQTINGTKGMSIPYFGLRSRYQFKEDAPGVTLPATAGFVRDCGVTMMNLTAAGTTRPAYVGSTISFRRRLA